MLVTDGAPVERDVALGIQPLLAAGGDVSVRPTLDDAVDLEHFVLGQRPPGLDLEEVEHRATEEVRVRSNLHRRPVRVARPQAVSEYQQAFARQGEERL